MRAILGLVTLVVLLGVALVGFAFLPENIQTTLMPPTSTPSRPSTSRSATPTPRRPSSPRRSPSARRRLATSRTQNYPHIVAKAIKPSSFTDMSCSGAFVKDLTEPQFTPKGTNASAGRARSAPTPSSSRSASAATTPKILTLFFECAGEPRDPTKPSNCVEKFKSDGKDGFLDAVHADATADRGHAHHRRDQGAKRRGVRCRLSRRSRRTTAPTAPTR